MDYKSVLKEQLLSKTNLDFLVNIILTNFKISNKAVGKCVNIITGNMKKYLNNLAEFPKNNNELIQAIHFLNNKCYDDFTEYLLAKYPDGNILRNNISISDISQPTTTTTNSINYQLPLQHIPNQIYNLNDIYPLTNQEKLPTVSPYGEIIIITEDEKNELIKKYIKTDNKQNLAHTGHTKQLVQEVNKTDEFLSYLTNPMVLQMFSTMVNQLNNNQNVVIKEKNPSMVFDKILNISQVQSLISKTAKETISSTSHTEQKSMSLLDELENNIVEQTDEIFKEEQAEIEIDLNNLTNETLVFVQQKIKELTEEKNRYASEKNFKMAKQIEKERTKIMDAVNAHKQKIKKQVKENEKKANSILLSNAKDLGKDNVVILNLQFDPLNDYNDLKNIVIGLNPDDKISEISLISYHLPFNPNNVTRFNNKFVVYFNNKINKIIIPPSNYDIKLLLDAIKAQVNFLDFSIGTNNIITIKNTISMKFDLMVGDDTIFPLLGFDGKPELYKDKLCYEASKTYNMEVNQKILFSLFGSTKDPIELEFDKEVKPQKPIILKKVARGISMKQIQIKLTNSLDQCYDFILPFKMCLSVTYIK